MKHQKFVYILIFAFLTVTLAYADANLKRFVLEPGHNRVAIKWEVEDESGVKGYEIQRGMNDHDFSKLAFVEAKKNGQPLNKYEYIDKSVFKSTTGGRTFFYRLKIVNTDGSFIFSKSEHVTPTISGARQTWGMIKAMFR